MFGVIDAAGKPPLQELRPIQREGGDHGRLDGVRVAITKASCGSGPDGIAANVTSTSSSTRGATAPSTAWVMPSIVPP
ncbi:MAG: hypothetical protein ABSF69_28110, partial [Polyangiaceae bacterium]